MDLWVSSWDVGANGPDGGAQYDGSLKIEFLDKFRGNAHSAPFSEGITHKKGNAVEKGVP